MGLPALFHSELELGFHLVLKLLLLIANILVKGWR